MYKTLPLVGNYYAPNSSEYDAVLIMHNRGLYDICSVKFKSGCEWIEPIECGFTLSKARKLLIDKYVKKY